MARIKTFLLALFFLCLTFCVVARKVQVESNAKATTEWIVRTFLQKRSDSTQVVGNPKIIPSEFGEAVLFDGQNDGIFLHPMPLAGLEQFTVEAIFRPDGGGNFEQRFFHCGEIKGSRVMLELRSTPKGWYFDTFLNANSIKKTLVDSTLLHSSNRWYRVAFVVDRGKLTTYVNGKKELQDSIPMTPFFTGKTSLGVRQNGLSWFKGAIYKIRITPKALKPDFFIKR